MEPQFNQQEPVVIKERSESSNWLWYILGILLLLGLLGWYGFTAGWFGSRNNTHQNPATPGAQVQQQDQGFGERTVINPAPIDSVIIETAESFPVQQTLVIKGNLPNGCWFVNEPQQIRDGNVFYVTVDTYQEGEVCTQALVPYEKRVVLQTNNLPAGVYIVNVNGQELSFEFESDNVLDFEAGADK